MKYWTPDSDWQIQVTDSTPPAQIAQKIIESSTISQVRVGYALRELFIALGKLFQLYNTADQLSDNQSQKRFLILVAQCHEILLPLFQSNEKFEMESALQFLLNVISEIEKDYYDVEDFFSKEVEIDVLSVIAEYREVKALENFFNIFGQSYESKLIHEIEKEERLTSYLEEKSDYQVQWMIRNYRLAEWLLPWIKGNAGNSSLGQIYSALFKYEQNYKEQAMRNAENILEQINNEIQNVDVNREDLKSILHRVIEAIQYAGYEDFMDIATDSGQRGPQSILGAHGINVIPSKAKQPNACHEITLTIAKGPGTRGRKNFGSVLRELRGHLVQCFGRTKLVLMLHDEWDEKAMRESKLDLNAHREHGVCIIPLLVRGNEVSKVPLGL